MKRLPLRMCLETRSQPTAISCLLLPHTTAGQATVLNLGVSINQDRRIHHQTHHTRPQRGLSHRILRPPTHQHPQLSPLTTPNPISHRTYTTATTTTTTPPTTKPPEPTIDSLFDPHTCTWQYLVADPSTHTAAIIDPVLDYNPTTRTVSTTTADALLALIHARGYTISHILETHAHADHLTAAFYLQRRLAAAQRGNDDGMVASPPVGIGRRIGQVQSLFGERYGVERAEYEGVFDLLWEDDAVFWVGGLRGRVVHLPGHTPDHVGYWIGDNVFCGDSLFHPSLGTARCDFPGGSPQALYQSAKKLLALPDHVKIWIGHDYPVEGERGPEAWTTVGEHRARNKHIRDGVTEDEFVRMRSERDKNLAAPRLVHESLQVNIRGGQLPKVNAAGTRTLKVPVNVQGEVW